ncbi:MAG: hypothetical protein ACRELB_11655 [Polyangiaceae bacterium]
MISVVFHDHLDELRVVDAMRASDAERGAAMSARDASFRLRAWYARGPDATVLASLHALGFEPFVGVRPSGLTREQLERRLVEAVERGRLLVVVRPRRRVVVPLETAAEPVLGPSDAPGSWVEIELVDDKGQPVPDEPYLLVTGDGRTRSGTLDWRGFAREDGIDPGDCKIGFPRRFKWKAA